MAGLIYGLDCHADSLRLPGQQGGGTVPGGRFKPLIRRGIKGMMRALRGMGFAKYGRLNRSTWRFLIWRR
jgi:hypothetical protein